MVLTNSRVLVVDDDVYIRSLLQDFLTREGYGVVCHSSAVEALKFLRTSSADADPPVVSVIDPPRPVLDEEPVVKLTAPVLLGAEPLPMLTDPLVPVLAAPVERPAAPVLVPVPFVIDTLPDMDPLDAPDASVTLPVRLGAVPLCTRTTPDTPAFDWSPDLRNT
jgi:CheY-like chemotaxis protein